MHTEQYLALLQAYEPAAVRFLPNIVWASADGYRVTDVEGVTRIDFCAGAMIANAGHNNKDIIDAIKAQLETGVYTTYLFPNKPRCRLLKTLSALIPPDYQIALFNTGTEAVETAVKIARIYGHKVLKNKSLVVTFNNAYHGKLIGSTAISGTKAAKYWLPNDLLQALSIQVPFPSCPYEPRPLHFSDFVSAIHEHQVSEQDIAAVLIEPYQGGSCAFLPFEYAQSLRRWCEEHRILLIADEVQSGMGRTGKMWACEHLGIVPDIIVGGKGIGASLPLSAVIGRKDLFDLCEVGNFNSTHSGNPVCCAAADANIQYLLRHRLTENAEKMGVLLGSLLSQIQHQYPWFISYVLGKGLVYAIHVNTKYKPFVRPLVDICIKNGLLLISPGGVAGTAIKLIPPLIIDAKGIKEACAIIEKSISEIILEQRLSEKN